MTPPTPRPVYLVELFSLESGGLDWADVSASLGLALEEVYWHLLTYDAEVDVKVSEDAQGQLEGVAFLRDDNSILATITAYHLERETVDATEQVKVLHQAAELQSAGLLQQALTRVF
jgi:hypothetical protein